MLSLAERHAARIQRKAENQRGAELGGNPSDEKNTFIEGEDGFSRAGIGVVNPNFVNVVPSDQVNDTFGQIDPITGAAAEAGVEAADASAQDAEKAGWGASGGSAGTAAQAGNGGDASQPQGASVEGSTKAKGSK